MNLQKEFRTLILPILRGAPIIIIIIMIAVIFMMWTINHTVPKFQSSGSVKIDMRDFGISSFNLFDTEGGSAGSFNNFLTEVELIHSKSIKERAFKGLPSFELSIFRKGKVTTVELYENRPFEIEYTIHDTLAYDKESQLVYLGEDRFKIISPNIEGGNTEVDFYKQISNEKWDITLVRNDMFLQEKPNALRVGDVFHFTIHSLNSLVKSVDAKSLFIKPVDKEIYVVKVYYEHEVPKKAAMFVNRLMDAYIEDDLDRKNLKAESTINFITKELKEVDQKLRDTESNLAQFRTSNDLLNTTLETDAILKELAKLDGQKIGYDIQEIELNNVHDFLQKDLSLTSFSPDFQAINDGTFKDNYKKLQAYEEELKVVRKSFTPTSSEVLAIQDKITRLRSFLLETIKKKLINTASKKAEIEKNLAVAQAKYEAFPEKQRKLIEMERDLSIIEQTFTYLNKKKMEISVANSANFSFHRVIDYAMPAKAPIKPNKALLLGIAVFLALVISLVIVFIRSFIVSPVEIKDELLTKTDSPLLAQVSKVTKGDKENIEPFINLYTNLKLLLKQDTSGLAKTVVISSQRQNEGKTFTTSNLGRVLAHYNHNVLVIDMNIHDPQLHKTFESENEGGVSAILTEELTAVDAIRTTNFERLDLLPAGNLDKISSSIVFSPITTQLIDELKAHYDYILIDTPPLEKVMDAVPLMHHCSTTLYVVRANYTKMRKLGFIDKFVEEYQVPNLHLVFNGYRSKLKTYRQRPKGIWGKFKYFLSSF